MQGAGGVGGLLAVIREDGAYLPTYDANGNVSEYVSASDGSVAAHYDYSPFGETLVASGPLVASFTHRFSTKPYCQTTGFCEYQMRKYRPNLGRWMSRDMLLDSVKYVDSEERSMYEYVFCNNSTTQYFDFVGEYAVAIPVIIGAAEIIEAAVIAIGAYVIDPIPGGGIGYR